MGSPSYLKRRRENGIVAVVGHGKAQGGGYMNLLTFRAHQSNRTPARRWRKKGGGRTEPYSVVLATAGVPPSPGSPALNGATTVPYKPCQRCRRPAFPPGAAPGVLPAVRHNPDITLPATRTAAARCNDATATAATAATAQQQLQQQRTMMIRNGRSRIPSHDGLPLSIEQMYDAATVKESLLDTIALVMRMPIVARSCRKKVTLETRTIPSNHHADEREREMTPGKLRDRVGPTSALFLR
ncbi:hypothetical protein HPP92_029110, partial [Vanilla planifolia]